MRRTYRRTLTALVAAAAAGLGLAAPAGVASAATATASKPMIYWLEQGAGNPYWNAQHLAAAQAGVRLGYNFKSFSGNLSATDQASILKQLADQKPALIMLNSIDPTSIIPSIKYAESKGVPVLSLYSTIPQATASIGFNEVRSGQLAAKQAGMLLKERYGKLTGTIAVLGGVEGQPTSDFRADGFIDYVKAHMPGVTTVFQPTNWDASQASAAMQDWLTKYPNLSMVYGLSDTITVPAAEVAQRQNRLCVNEAGKGWTSNANCIIFISVDGFFLNDDVNGTLYSDEMYSPQWSAYVYGEDAYNIVEHKSYQKNEQLNSLLVTSANAACALKMQNAMASSMATFDFTAGPTLQDVAAHYGCKVLDANQ
jgi:ABC-type sugar transport system substrate-binding protein